TENLFITDEYILLISDILCIITLCPVDLCLRYREILVAPGRKTRHAHPCEPVLFDFEIVIHRFLQYPPTLQVEETTPFSGHFQAVFPSHGLPCKLLIPGTVLSRFIQFAV